MVFDIPACKASFRFFSTVLAVWFSASPALAQDDRAHQGIRPVVALETTTLRGEHYEADIEGGGLAQLTLNTAMQKSMDDAFASHPVPFAAATAISIPDGKVLVLAGYSQNDPSLDAATLALRPWAPAASVFKVVAASALIQEGHVKPSTKVCYHGGTSAIRRDNLIDVPYDRSCASLGYAIGKSQNAIIGKLAVRNLLPDQLERIATAFGFGQTLDFDAEVEPSEIDIPRDPLEFARAAAGFWHSSLSVFHGALLAATIANHGVMPAAHIVERAVDAQGATRRLPPSPSRRVIDPAVAEQVGEMMELTTSMGTARRGFHDRKGHPYLPVEVAGKTGTLFYRGRPQDPALPSMVGMSEDERLMYSWFIGFAPVDKPKIAFAILVGNPISWRIKAHTLARFLVADYLAAKASGKHDPLVAHR